MYEIVSWPFRRGYAAEECPKIIHFRTRMRLTLFLNPFQCVFSQSLSFLNFLLCFSSGEKCVSCQRCLFLLAVYFLSDKSYQNFFYFNSFTVVSFHISYDLRSSSLLLSIYFKMRSLSLLTDVCTLQRHGLFLCCFAF